MSNGNFGRSGKLTTKNAVLPSPPNPLGPTHGRLDSFFVRPATTADSATPPPRLSHTKRGREVSRNYLFCASTLSNCLSSCQLNPMSRGANSLDENVTATSINKRRAAPHITCGEHLREPQRKAKSTTFPSQMVLNSISVTRTLMRLLLHLHHNLHRKNLLARLRRKETRLNPRRQNKLFEMTRTRTQTQTAKTTRNRIVRRHLQKRNKGTIYRSHNFRRVIDTALYLLKKRGKADSGSSGEEVVEVSESEVRVVARKGKRDTKRQWAFFHFGAPYPAKSKDGKTLWEFLCITLRVCQSFPKPKFDSQTHYSSLTNMSAYPRLHKI